MDFSKQPYVTLNNGTRIPSIGLGSFLSDEGDIEPVIVAAILEHGYRHIDTASFYKNEEAIGRALTQVFANSTTITRNEVYITTKLHYQEKDDVEGAVR